MANWLKLAGVSGVASATLFVAGYVFILPNLWTPSPPRDFNKITGNIESGEYLVRIAGCVACHTDIKNKGPLFAGGTALKTPFGTFYGPNITSDKNAGIGGWSLSEFAQALTAGLSPKGTHYFPAFPYANYSKFKTQDIADIKAYLDTVPPIAEANNRNDLIWPFSDRSLMAGWKWLFFEEGEYVDTVSQSQAWNRGAYLVTGPAHCGACHTDRNILGATVSDKLTGTRTGPGGFPVPGISIAKHQLKGWTVDDLTFGLQTGLKPDGDVMGGAMGEVIEEGTSYMTDQDLAAIAEYLFSKGGKNNGN